MGDPKQTVRISSGNVALICEVGHGSMGVPDMNEQTLFGEALERTDPQVRAAFLDQACRGDPAIRERIERLLAQHQHAGAFLESPAAPPGETLDEPITERPGTDIGPYKLLEQVGEGGMGTVWMAQQTEPVKLGRGEADQAGHGLETGHRPLRSRAPGVGADGSPEYRPRARWRHDQ